MDSYQRLITRLYRLAYEAKKAKYTLDRTYALYKCLHFPGKTIPMVHIAGTNGKGSVAYKMAKALTHSGYKTALFTSPHISSFRERIQIDFQKISKEEIVEFLCPLFKWIDERKIEIHFFEVLTILALQYFEKGNIDIAVIEAGLGGRLDATNIITPILSVIVSVGYDHCHILGNTLEEISFEKAGIIKPNTAVVIGSKANYPPIIEAAKKNNSACHVVQGDFSSFDEYNQAIARCCLQKIAKTFPINRSLVDKALLSNPFCRMEEMRYKDKRVILDVAHNDFGLAELKKALRKKYPDRTFEVHFALSKDKGAKSFCEELQEMASKIHLISYDHPRLEKVDNLIFHLDKKHPLYIHSSFQEILDQLEGDLLVCGSFFIMAKVRSALNITEERDELDINEAYAVHFKKSKEGESFRLIH